MDEHIFFVAALTCISGNNAEFKITLIQQVSAGACQMRGMQFLSKKLLKAHSQMLTITVF